MLFIKNTKGKLTQPYKSGHASNEVYISQSKQCALICVDVVLNDHIESDPNEQSYILYGCKKVLE